MPQISRPAAYLPYPKLHLRLTARSDNRWLRARLRPRRAASSSPCYRLHARFGRSLRSGARTVLIRGGARQKVAAGSDICPQAGGEVGRINRACDTAALHAAGPQTGRRRLGKSLVNTGQGKV